MRSGLISIFQALLIDAHTHVVGMCGDINFNQWSLQIKPRFSLSNKSPTLRKLMGFHKVIAACKRCKFGLSHVDKVNVYILATLRHSKFCVHLAS